MQYQELDKTKNEIRVLSFLDPSSPISTEDVIQCSIQNVPLEEHSSHFQSKQEHLRNQSCPVVWDKFTKCVDLRDATMEQTTLDHATSIGLGQVHMQQSNSRYVWGDFEALSYTWGDRVDDKSISVNGICIPVSRNLEAALRALRLLPETRLGMCYWVDSLCIDQETTEERNEQVKRMKEIYSRARAVIVWLGQEEETDRIAVETMRHLCRSPCVENMSQLPANLLLGAGSALSAFAKKPYWTRAWIIQELAVNHNSTLILCGGFKLTRRMIRLGAIYCQEFSAVCEDQSDQFDHDLRSDGWSTASRMYRLASLTFVPGVGVKLDLLLNLVRRAGATDDKDKIYSILGLLNPAISEDVVPDYSSLVSVQQVYTDFMVSVITKSGCLEQILFGGIPTKEGWPSWVPDWRDPFRRHHIRYLRCRQASGSLPPKIQFSKSEQNRDLLVCSGFQVDIVDGLATASSSDGCFTQSQSTLNRYSGRTSRALQQTLLLGRFTAMGNQLLKVPWISRWDVSKNPVDNRSTPKWLKLFESSYFEKFHQFRQYNQDFLIGGQSLRSFFPRFSRNTVNTETILGCIRLAVLSLDQRALITTRTGYLGLAPIAVRPGDVVAILLGCKCPVVLRRYRNDQYHVIGECYVHELMDGEILSQKCGENVSRREFVLC